MQRKPDVPWHIAPVDLRTLQRLPLVQVVAVLQDTINRAYQEGYDVDSLSMVFVESGSLEPSDIKIVGNLK